MRINETHLLAKGWTSAEISHARNILQKEPANHSLLDHIEYFLVIIMGIALNTAMAFFLIPALLVLPVLPLITVLIISGSAFGTAYSMILSLLEKHSPHKHIIAIAIVPTIALISFIIVGSTIEQTVQAPISGLAIGGIYSVSFLVPHLIGGKT